MAGKYNMRRVSLVCTMVVMTAMLSPSKARGDEPTTQPYTDVNASVAVLLSTTSPAAESSLAGLSLEDLMNQEVTSVSKSKQRLGDSAAAVTVITPEDMDRSGLHEIPEMLRLVPGLFVQRGNQFTGWSVASRGFGALFDNKLLVLQDGRTLYTPLFSGVYWNTVDYPSADLDRIEVIRGPGATLWGSNAVNGVINITTKSAEDTQGFLLDSRVGTDESDSTIQYGGKIDDKTFYRVYAKGSVYADEKQSPQEIGNRNQWQDYTSGFRIDRHSSDKDTLTVQGDAFDQSASDELVTGHLVPNYSHDYRSGENVLARFSHVDSDTSDYSLQTYFDRTDLRDGYGRFIGDAFDVDFQQRFELMKGHEIIYGLGARLMNDNVGTNALIQPVVDPTSRDTVIGSGFVQDTMTIVPDRLQFVFGSKFEDNSVTGVEIQPSARLLWTPSDDTSVWGAVSRAARTPSRLEWDDAVRIIVPTSPGHSMELSKSTDHPDSEELLAYELGMRKQITKGLSVDATAFTNVYQHLIGLETTGTTHPGSGPSPIIFSTYANDQSARTYGTEIALNWQATDNWRLSGSYSFFSANVHDDTTLAITPDAKALDHSTPRDQFQVHSYLDITKELQFNASTYYVEQVTNANVIGTIGKAPGSYVRTDFGLTWHPKPNLEISAGIQNAFDPHHLESAFNGPASSEVNQAAYIQGTWSY